MSWRQHSQAGAAKQAGFPDSELATATAVALAESGGETTATNRNTNGSTDYGLWQINTVHGSLLSSGDKFSALDNARMAFTVYSRAGNKWTPWVTYNRGTYRTFLPQASLAARSPSAPSVAGQTGGGTRRTQFCCKLKSLCSGFHILCRLLEILNRGLWARIGVMILGSVLILFSLWKLTGAGDIIVQAAGMQARRVIGAR